MLFHIPCASREQRPVFRTTNPYNGTFKRDFEGDYKCTCVHSDFSVNANLLVKHEKNTFIFSNPGTMLITKSQYYKGGQSVCRNKSLQKMFMMLGAAEKAGSGVDKILKGWSDSNWRSPNIETSFRPDTIKLYLPMVSLLDENVKNGLIRLFGKGVVHVKHNWLQTLALTFTEGYVTNERLRYALKIHRADIYPLLKDMCKEGYLIAEGHGRGTKYYLPALDVNIGSNPVSNPVSNPISNPISNPVSNPISKPKKRMSREEIREAIISVSADWVSLDYIASEIDRTTAYLLADIIPPMLEEGLMERMYPDSPTSPYQKYKACLALKQVDTKSTKMRQPKSEDR